MKPFEITSDGYLANRDAYFVTAEFHDGMKMTALIPAIGNECCDSWEFDVFEDQMHKYTFEADYECGYADTDRKQPEFGGIKFDRLCEIFEDARQNYLTRIGA